MDVLCIYFLLIILEDMLFYLVPAEDCSTGFFLCNDGQCLLDYRRCNGVPECSGSEDEHGCDSVRECLEDDIGLSYRVKVNVTISGITCQDWSSQSPHVHDYEVFFYSNNYCRNVELDTPKPWCYTTDKDIRWQYCDIPLCEVDTTTDELTTQTTTVAGDASSAILIGMMDNKTTTKATITQVTSTTTDASVQPTICSQCLCSNSQIVLSGQELQDKLKDLYTLLSVNKRNTSLYLRTQSSATDTRLSSKSIGVTRVILLLSVMLFILVLDILPRK